jgi:SNF2 family DNA or RNA helicase
MIYNINTIDDIDHTKKNMFMAHTVHARPVKPEHIGKTLEELIVLYKNDEYDDEKELYEDQEKIHNAIKNVDLRKISEDPRVIKGYSNDDDNGPVNKYLLEHETRIDRWGYDIPHDLCEMYVIEYLDFDCIVTVIFMEFKQIELLTEDIIMDERNEYITIRNCSQWHTTSMDHLNTACFTQYTKFFLNKLQKQLEQPREYLALTKLSFQDTMKTKLFNYQLDNINWMIDYEQNPIRDRYIMDDDLLFFPDGRVWSYWNNRFITEEDPIVTVRGGIIMDETGIGKTLQALCLARTTPDLKTLIVVPDHLLEHWQSENKKHFEKEVSYLSIIKRSSYKCYRKKYDRIIFDEIHELYVEKDPEDDEMDSELFRKAIFDNCKYKWGLTATPFVVEHGLFHIMRFLTCQGIKKESYLDKDYDPRDFDKEYNVMYSHFQYIYERIFRRNMLENIKDELVIPECITNNVFIDFNQIERLTYDSEVASNHTESKNSNIDALRQFCCDMALSFSENNINITFDQFKNNIILLFENKVNNETVILNTIKKQYENTILKNTASDYYLNLFNKQKKIVDIKLNALKKIKNGFLNIFKCAVCMCDVDTTQPFTMITACNHVFCKECIDEWIAFSHTNCPTCMRKFKKTELCTISTDSNNDEKEKEKYAQFSSKIKELLTKLDLIDGKVIIYTQFDNFVKKIMTIFNSQNKKSMIFTNSGDVELFKTNDCKVIFLSSIHNASGIDLSFASETIILEPIKSQNNKFVKDIENQIIGRTRRIGQKNKTNVTRLIIKDTIEEQIYNECNIFKIIEEEQNNEMDIEEQPDIEVVEMNE